MAQRPGGAGAARSRGREARAVSNMARWKLQHATADRHIIAIAMPLGRLASRPSALVSLAMRHTWTVMGMALPVSRIGDVGNAKRMRRRGVGRA